MTTLVSLVYVRERERDNVLFYNELIMILKKNKFFYSLLENKYGYK